MPKTDICIIGAGVSGLALATFLRRKRPDLDLAVLEKDERPGGAVRTFQQDGWMAEYAPHGFLDNCPESQELIGLAGLEAERQTAPLSRFVRYLALSGRLELVPQSPKKILMAPLMGWRDKFSLVWSDIRTPALGGKPTVADWVVGRFGPALLPFADAVLTGTWAGNINELRIDGVMPGLRALEREHGSIIKALMAKKKAGAGKRGLPAMQSFTEGMEALPKALAKPLLAEGRLHLCMTALGISHGPDGWTVRTNGEDWHCRRLVLALPVNVALKLAGTLSRPPVPNIPEAALASVILGFDEKNAEIPFGFGYLAPRQENRFALGALFSTHMFPGRAPEGGQMLEVLVGGTRHPEHLTVNDQLLEGLVLADLRQLMKLGEPKFSVVLRGAGGIPQATADYLRLLPWRDKLHETQPGLHLLGFGWKGIGLNEMIREAHHLADTLTGAVGDSEDRVKGIYM